MLELSVKKGDPKTLILFWEGEPLKEVSKSLFFSELRKFPDDLTREDFQARFAALEERVGRRYAAWMLAQRALLSSVLEAKLRSKGLSQTGAKAVVAFCVERGFLNDSEQIGRLVARELKKGRSAKAIFFKLKAKGGVDLNCLREHLDQSEMADECALETWLKKNRTKIEGMDFHQRRKVAAKLCRKGFSVELVFKALDDI